MTSVSSELFGIAERKELYVFVWANRAMLLVFVLSAAVQVNDPDPFGWIFVYGCAAAAAALRVETSRSLAASAAVGIVSLIWLFVLFPDVWGRIAVTDVFRPMHEKGGVVEVGREVGGLLIVFGWMLVRVIVGRAAQRQPTPVSDGVNLV